MARQPATAPRFPHPGLPPNSFRHAFGKDWPLSLVKIQQLQRETEMDHGSNSRYGSTLLLDRAHGEASCFSVCPLQALALSVLYLTPSIFACWSLSPFPDQEHSFLNATLKASLL